MIYLTLESTNRNGGVALFRENQLLSSILWSRKTSHSEVFPWAIQSCLEIAQIHLREISDLVVDIGPGSFTGVRVAVNIARSVAYSTGVKIFSLTSLEILAYSLKSWLEPGGPVPNHPIICLLNAHKNLVYFARYQFRGEEFITLDDPQVGTIEQALMTCQSPHLCLGEAGSIHSEKVRKNGHCLQFPILTDSPGAAAMGQLFMTSLPSRQSIDWKKLKPLYIRSSSAEERFDKGLS